MTETRGCYRCLDCAFTTSSVEEAARHDNREAHAVAWRGPYMSKAAARRASGEAS